MADEDKKTIEEVKAEEAAAPVAETPAEANKTESPASMEDKKAPKEEAEEETADDTTKEGTLSAEETPAEEEATIEEVETENVKPEEAQQKIETGMVVRVHVKIKDVTPRGDERERIQVFEGTVINKGGQDAQSATITVRKVSGGVGVERIFPLQMPAIEKIEVIKQYRTRRSKLFFLRGKYKKRIKEVAVNKQ